MRHLDGSVQRIKRIGSHRDEHGWATDFSFENPEAIPFAVRDRLHETFTKLVPTPKVDDFATLHYPSDSYPYEVISVSPTGRKVTLRELSHRVIAGSFITGDAVVQYDNNLQGSIRVANWSPKRGRFTCGGSPISFGFARFYQAPEV